MKIGIDARFYGSAGPGRYVANLVRELEEIDKENDYIIFVNKKGSEEYHPKNPRFKKWLSDYKWYTFEEQTGFVGDLLRARLDLLHVPFLNVPVLYPKKMVVTIHDLTMHDFSTAAASTLGPVAYKSKRLVYKFLTSYAAIKAKRIIVPTEFIRDDIVKRLTGAKFEKVVVTHEGVDPKLVQYKIGDKGVLNTRLEELKVKSNYLFYAGSAYPHKNLEALIISYRDAIKDSSFNNQLIVAGKVDSYSNQIAGFSHGLGLDGKVVFVAKYCENTYVDDKDLAYLYQGALAYFFPSLNEGFSITPLEAQTFGVPVALSDIPAHREVFGDSVMYFDPTSNLDMTEKMILISKDLDLRNDLIKKGYENVKKYSWRQMASKTKDIYDDVLGIKK